MSASLDGEDFLEKANLTRRARYARDFLMNKNSPEPQNIPRTLQKDIEMTRLRLIECREPQRYDIWFHSLYQVARSVNPMLSTTEGLSLWTRLESSPCFASLEASQRRWIDMFKAVGSRNGEQMGQMAALRGLSG